MRCFVRYEACIIAILAMARLALAAPPPAMPADPAVAEVLKQLAGDEFRIKETDHFTVAYDTPYEHVRALTGRIEGTFDAVWFFCEKHGLKVEPPRERLQVLLFDRHEDFAAYGAAAGMPMDGTAGFYDQRTNRSAFGNALNSPSLAELVQLIDATERERDRLQQHGGAAGREAAAVLAAQAGALRGQREALVKRFNRFVVQHEVAHHALFHIGVHVRGAVNPPWLVEGMACQFEVAQPQARHGRLRVNQVRLADFRHALGLAPKDRDLAPNAIPQAVAEKRWLSLRQLVENTRPFTDAGDAIAFRYAQAWALVHFLHREHHDAFGGYLRRLSERIPGQGVSAGEEWAEFARAFSGSPDELERQWVEFVLKLPVRPDETE